jgi:hypothetical protein
MCRFHGLLTSRWLRIVVLVVDTGVGIGMWQCMVGNSWPDFVSKDSKLIQSLNSKPTHFDP